MPVNFAEKTDAPLIQRELYAKSRLTRIFWNMQDRVVINSIPANAAKIVDFGCGEGITLEHIAKHFSDTDVSGVEYMPENVEICRKHGLNVTRGDIYNLEIPPESVDAAVFIHVIEHLENYHSALAALYSVLKNGGKLIMGFPNDTAFYLARLAMFKWKEANYDYGHVRKWTPKKACIALTDAGFKNCKSTCLPLRIWPMSLAAIVVAEK